MTDQPTTPASYTEAPASWNVKYNLLGFDCQLTLRDASGAALLTKAGVALAKLVELGATPTVSVHNGNGNGKAAPAAAPILDNGQPDPAWCSIHGCAMSRHEKDGKVWYSHKVGEGEYCKGK